MELKGVEGTEIVNGEVDLERELEEYRKKCKDLEEISRKDEERCILLEGMFELLESRFHELEDEKVGIQDEVKVLNRRNTELEEQINKLEEENNVVCEDKVTDLMIENKVLECEKKRAESEAEAWKLKFRKLESRVLELEKQNLVLRSGQNQLLGMMESEPEMHEKQTSKASNVKDEILSKHLDTEYKKVNDNETVHAAVGVSSTCCSPVNGVGDFHAAVTPLIDMPSKHFKQAEGRKRGIVSEDEKNHRSRVRKQLEFGEEGNLNMKMAPSTPAFPRHSSFGIIDISDNKCEVANVSVDTPCDGNRMASVSTDFSPGTTMDDGNKNTSDGNFRTLPLYQSDEEDMKDYEGSFPFIPTPKRKRASNIVSTDSESDSEDNIPICKLKTKHRESNHDSVDSDLNTFPVNATLSEENVNDSATHRRRLVALRECNVKNEPEQKSHRRANYDSGIPTNAGVENGEMEENELESDSEGESLDGFIVESSDISESEDGSNESEHVLDDDVDFNEVLSRIRRSKDVKVKWEFEADMLAAFGRNLELCMKAVCALYRKQTADEKLGKFTYYCNQQGFSQCDALRGSKLAEFLTDGDGQGDVKKSVQELREYDPKAPELCRTLATHYSKQLFAIYNSKEDPFFLSS